jgi:uncharacterized protein (DUF58 family)
MLANVKKRFRTWALRRQRYDDGTVVLTQRRIYIIPTRQGFALAFVLVLMLLGDINYNLSLGYVLTFLLAMMAVMSMLHAFRNMAQLQVRAGHVEPVFAKDSARFVFHFHNSSRLDRYRIKLHDMQGHKTVFDVAAHGHSEVVLSVPTTQRGWLTTGRVALYTHFPLGLFHAWSYLHFDTRCLVYPKPLSHAPLPPGGTPDGAGKRTIVGDEDFSGLRKYVPGDALQRIAWKVLAREQGLQVKQFSTPIGEELWLDYSAAAGFDDEEKLARMASWVLDAEAQELRYGLRLPDGELPANLGAAHRDECLRRIALFNLPQQDGPLAHAEEELGRGRS